MIEVKIQEDQSAMIDDIRTRLTQLVGMVTAQTAAMAQAKSWGDARLDLLEGEIKGMHEVLKQIAQTAQG